jgi:predicted homoserine dehydrogenase-like protein
MLTQKSLTQNSKVRIGIVGTGFIGQGIVLALAAQADLNVTKVLTRRKISADFKFVRPELLTDSIDELIENSDLVVECTGSVLWATVVLDRVLAAGLPVVTMDSEVHVTTGSYLAQKGFITEAEGDQPGCLAALNESAIQMGFKPLVYGNIKGFLNLLPTPEDMIYWSDRQGISLDQVTSFTDGTKVQIEQAFVANGLGADVLKDGLMGPSSEDIFTGGVQIAEEAKRLGKCVSDYILSPKSPAGVFIIAEHEAEQKDYLRYLKMGEGPFYSISQNYHLCHLEVAKTIRRVVNGGGVLLNNSKNPTVGVMALAKKNLTAGTSIQRGIGGFEVRGIASKLSNHPNAVPIGILEKVTVTKPIEAGQILTFDDVEIPDSLALDICLKLRDGLA